MISEFQQGCLFPMTNRAVFIDAGHGGRDPAPLEDRQRGQDKPRNSLRLKRLVEEGEGLPFDRDGDCTSDAPNKNGTTCKTESHSRPKRQLRQCNNPSK